PQSSLPGFSPVVFPFPSSPSPVPPPHPSSSTTSPPPYLSEEHIRHTLFRLSSSKAGGPSGIPISIVRTLWPVLSTRLTSIYRAAIELGYHPQAWRNYTGVVLRKPGKPDYSVPKAYRLIALEETMSKVLEGAVEEWLRWKAEWKMELPVLQFGGRKGRSCEDAVLWVVEKVKERWRTREVAVGLSLDAQGAFPGVRAGFLLDLLLEKLEEEFSPLAPWLSSFLSDRSCRLSIEGELTALLDGNCGLPQGSPLSPLLYTLYNSGLLDAFSSPSTAGVGFVDDLFALSWGKTVTEGVGKLQERVSKVERWGEKSSTVFEPEKSGWMVFARGNRWRVEAAAVKIVVCGVEVPRKEKLRFLGVPLDGELRLREFVEERVAAGRKVLHGLRALSSVTRGVSFTVARQLVIACVFPRLDFLSVLWWKAPGHVDALRRFDHVQREAAQFISGGLRSTSLPALEVSAYLFPTKLRVERAAYRSSVRHRTLPARHPLRPFLSSQHIPCAKHPSPLSRLSLAFPHLSSLRIETIDPRTSLEPGTTHLHTPAISIAPTKELALLSHDAVLGNAPASALILYSDGSL
ncbi:hypothetical protein JCM11641_006111, partial [Rhodosporidiobolus odoratus]